MSKSAGGFCDCEGCVVAGFDIDFLIARDLALEGDIFALMLDGDRGMSGDTLLEGAILDLPGSRLGQWPATQDHVLQRWIDAQRQFVIQMNACTVTDSNTSKLLFQTFPPKHGSS